MYRCFIRSALIIPILAALSQPAGAFSNIWGDGRSGTVHPAYYFPGFRSGRARGNGTGLICSVSNPYSIPGLYRMMIEISCGAAQGTIRGNISHLDSRLYREGLYSAGFVSGQIGGLSAGVIGSFSRKSVRGIRPESSFRLKAAVSYEWENVLSAGYERIFNPGKGYALTEANIIISVELGRGVILYNRRDYGCMNKEAAVGLEFSLTGRFALLSGYRFGEGELSFGIIYRWKKNCFGFSWREHPVLGTTAACGVGRFSDR